MNFYFRLRGPVDDNNSEEINLPQMQESRYRGNPERLLPDVGIDSLAERDVLLVFKKNAEKKMRVVPGLEGMMDR
jgi:hypothetical protein